MFSDLPQGDSRTVYPLSKRHYFRQPKQSRRRKMRGLVGSIMQYPFQIPVPRATQYYPNVTVDNLHHTLYRINTAFFQLRGLREPAVINKMEDMLDQPAVQDLKAISSPSTESILKDIRGELQNRGAAGEQPLVANQMMQQQIHGGTAPASGDAELYQQEYERLQGKPVEESTGEKIGSVAAQIGINLASMAPFFFL